ncbi:Radical SAM domain protein [Paramagnetospirillum magnetotacticum MS-1]|uniref:Radical SAM domain protein n=1 Tax=Paramagnetospirillum magnetotacticum MS-1 TaxID=272627 RepID=A0A0C2UB45_PARME|nr:radical SAM protein [Paramagnetospirillum magnetotacticum]KIL98712.1 Radical SAM domain protein [Paramagnetospirillum magnetotacticum MS-1]
MRILLINPPDRNKVVENPDENGEEFLEADSFGDFPPLGALYVLSHLEAHSTGHQLFFKDCVAERSDYEQLRAYIEDIRPDVVGITSFTVCLMDVVLTARLIREVVPDVHLCLGGHHPIAYPKEAAELPEFDSVVVGEGEEVFTELVGRLETGRDFTDIRGVYTRDSIGRHLDNPVRDKRFLARVTVPAAYVEDIDALPMLNRAYIRQYRYHNIIGSTDDLATILSSRGCPYRCTFCDVPIKSYRERSPAAVCDEIEACLAMGYKEFRFYDDLFNINERKVIAFCDELDRRGLRITWDFRGRVNAVSRESLVRARASGLRMISFGVETGSDDGLRILKKATTTAKIRQAFAWCRELGILTVADYIIGQPFEKTPDDIRRNIDFLVALDPDYAQISVLKLYPNTEMYDDATARGVVAPGRWQEFSVNPRRDFIVDHWNEFMDLTTLVREQKRAYRRFYFRLPYILRSVRQTGSLYQFLSKAKGAMKLIKTNLRMAG